MQQQAMKAPASSFVNNSSLFMRLTLCRSEIDYTSAAAAIIEQAQAQANKIAQDNQNSAALDPSDTVKSPQQTPASLQFDIPQKTTKVKDIRVR